MSEKVSSIMWFSLAVQALLVLADHDGLCNSNKLAVKLDSESGFLRKILSNLVKAGLIQAKEGRDGGIFTCQKSRTNHSCRYILCN